MPNQGRFTACSSRPPANSHRMASPERTIRIIGVPMDLGQQRRGVDMGPSALRYAGLFAYELMSDNPWADEWNSPSDTEKPPQGLGLKCPQALLGFSQGFLTLGPKSVR